MKETGRNDPCPCGSGKKYKQCCQQRENPAASGRIAAADIPAALQAALDHHRAGRLPQAQAIYRQILEAEPDHADALHYLGAIAFHEGKHRDAAELIGRAIRIRPSRTMHYNLGNALKALGDLDGAAESYRHALALKPDYAEAHVNLGNVLQAQGKLDEAVGHYRSALLSRPDLADTHVNLGNALRELGKLYEAVESYQRALALRPDLAEAHYNLGIALQTQNNLDAAVDSYRKALALKPEYAEAHYNLGLALQTQNNLDAAVDSYRKALALKPDYAEAHYNLGLAFQAQNNLDAAVDSYRKALALKPDYAEAYINLGNALSDQGKLDEAIEHCRQALALKPDSAAAYNNLGMLYKDAARLDEAIACLRRAVALNSHNNTEFHSNLLYTLYFHPAYDDRSILAEVKQFASAHHLPRSPSASSHARLDNTPGRRLRIGYVSPDFRNHCQSLFTIPLLSNHDHTQFEIYCYANLVRRDEISERLATYADVWRSTNGISDTQLAEIIANDGIDILIDLTMHMAKGRPMLFARKPAPVQIAWLAYPGTTGIPEIDYRLTDPWLDPPELGDDRYTETSIRLPDTFWCYDPLVSGLHPNALPALAAGYVTFGCLNNFCKITDDTLCRWGQVMARTPSSRLILLARAGTHRQRVLDILGQFGVAAERIEFVGHKPRAQYLQTYHHIDLCLDTLPANGHTTSLDSFWMGVPVVTKVGHTAVGRGGWSLLNNLGLPELAAFDDQAFIDIAAALAADLPRLSQLRHTLRNRMEASPLMDGKRFATAIETAYRQIWKNRATCQRNIESD